MWAFVNKLYLIILPSFLLNLSLAYKKFQGFNEYEYG